MQIVRIQLIERFPTPFLFLFWQITESRAVHACVSAAERLLKASYDRMPGPSFTMRDLAAGTVTQGQPLRGLFEPSFEIRLFVARTSSASQCCGPWRVACIEHRRLGTLLHIERLAEFRRVLSGPLEFEGREKSHFGKASRDIPFRCRGHR